MFDNDFPEANEPNFYASPIHESLFPDLDIDAEDDSFSKKPFQLCDELELGQNWNELKDNQENPNNKIQKDEIIPEIKVSPTDISTFKNKKRCNPDKEMIFSIKKRFKKGCQKLPAYWRFDSAVKFFKTNIIDYAYHQLNKLIQESDLPSELKAKNIYKPNSTLFTAVASMKENYEFLSKTIKEIFSIGKEKAKCNKQQENDKALSKIHEMVKSCNLSESNEKLREFMNKTYEELIKDFYRTDEFGILKNSEIAEFHNEGMIKQEKLSLLENDGLLNLITKKRAP